MTPMTSISTETRRTIGKLCVGGDWACAHGDFETLRFVVQQLEDLMPERIHCELAELAAACISDPERAGVLWDRLKSHGIATSLG